MGEGEEGGTGGTGKWWLTLVVGIVLIIWGIVGHEPCVIVPGIVVAALGLVMLGIISGAFIRKADE